MAEFETMDTPQATAPVVEEPRSVDISDEGTLVEDVIFGGEQGSVSEAFVEPGEQGQEPIQTQEEPSVHVPSQGENDEVRYQYWQSQADKLKNERDQLQSQFNTLATQQTPQTQDSQKEPEPEPEAEFPAPPEKPAKPYNFSMDEAMSDAQSESAQFVQQEQSWRDEMDEYKSLQFEYQMAMMKDERDNFKQERQDDIQRREADQAQTKQMNDLKGQIMNQYKVDTNTAEDFVRVMSDPQSLSLDNLWKLYSTDKGLSTPQQFAAPSKEFQQVKRAQQIPTSMGVMPSQNRQNQGSVEDTVMDSMITDFNKQNPFN
jgi:hypothetical protein|tara:strand:+ start:5025 stop:5972 length:948 start_codon:yes stop_codon:yes gene_type:complete